MARCGSCQTITRGPNQSPRRCGSCGGPLVLNPTVDGFTDLRLTKAMDRLSAGGRLAYTEAQLYYATAPRRVVKPGFFKRLTGAKVIPAHVTTTVSYGQFERSLSRWRAAGGPITGRLLDGQALRTDPNRQAVDGAQQPAELTAHSFDRALFTDDGATAAMLVANNFHTDNRCAVLSEDGYPEAFRAELIPLLNRNPNLVVATLHGADPRGSGLIHRLRPWFPNPAIKLIEVGLRPAQVRKAKLPSFGERRDSPDPTVVADPGLGRLGEWEREWLAWGLQSPLAVLGPTRLAAVLSGVFNNLARIDERTFAERTDTTGGPDRSSFDDSGAGFDAGHGILWWDGASDDDNDSADDDFVAGVAGGAFDDGFDGADFDGDG